MPDPPIKPPNKRVGEINSELTESLWKELKPGEKLDIRNKKEVNFLLHEIAELRAENEMLWAEINRIKDFLVLDD